MKAQGTVFIESERHGDGPSCLLPSYYYYKQARLVTYSGTYIYIYIYSVYICMSDMYYVSYMNSPALFRPVLSVQLNPKHSVGCSDLRCSHL